MKRTFLFFKIVFILLLLAGFTTDKAAINKPAPDFSLKAADGKTYSLSDFKGKYVILEWINFDCPFVRKHYKSGNMQNLQKKYTGKGVIWLSINSSAPGKQGNFPAEEVNRRLQKQGASPTAYLFDPSGTVGRAYGAKTTPHMYLIDPEGVLVYAGGIDDIRSTKISDIPKAKNYVSLVLEAALAGKPLPVQSTRPYGCSVKY